MADTIIHCVDCGAEVIARRSTTQRCPKCQAMRTKMLQREGQKRAKLRIKAKKVSDSSSNAICHYCGKPATKDGYCYTCISYGLDNLHREFGMTNGWDKKTKKGKGELVLGNRGVIPAGAITITDNSRFY